MDLQSFLTFKGVLVLICLALLFCAERLVPAAIRPDHRDSDGSRLGRNLSLWGINALLSPALVLPITAFGVAQGWGWRPDWMAGWAGVLIDLIVLDFWIYWWHRANHIVPLFWRFHRVHHMDEWLDVTSAVRFHFGEVLLSALARVPVILIMGMPLLSVIIFESLVLVLAGFQHSNLRLPGKLESCLSRIIITPSIHWVHHHVLRSDTNSNYGTFFSFWDRWFDSRSSNSRQLDMAIGLDDQKELKIFRLLLLPFSRKQYQD